MQEHNKKNNRKQALEQQPSALDGILPPQDVEMEKVVLGALMLEKGALDEVSDILSPDVFYSPQNAKIYQAIYGLYTASLPIDILTVTTSLQKSGDLAFVGGAVYISRLTSRVGSTAHLEYHARLLLQKASQRGLINVCSKTLKEAYEDTTDVFDLIDDAELGIMRLNQKLTVGTDARRIDDIVAENIKNIEQAINQNGTTGVPTGLTDLDRLTGGWQKTDLIVLAARPGMGKTALILKLAKAAAKAKKPTAIFSLEMNSLQLGNRELSVETGIENKKLSRGQFDVESGFLSLNKALAELSGLELYIDDTPGVKVLQLRAKAKKMKSKYDIQFLIVDYLQLMFADEKSGNREVEIASISRGLKRLAKELDIPIIAISALSRSVETRGGEKKPMLSDLRESGAIESDADLVGFLWRPEYYGIENDANGHPYAQGYTEIIIEKHRNGSVGVAKVKFIETTTDFVDLSNDCFTQQTNTPPATDYSASLKANKDFEAAPTPTDDLPF